MSCGVSPVNYSDSDSDSAYFECHDILMLGKSLIKWRQHADMTIVVDWDETHQIKQRNRLYLSDILYRIAVLFLEVTHHLICQPDCPTMADNPKMNKDAMGHCTMYNVSKKLFFDVFLNPI